jgi:hypothetical protein
MALARKSIVLAFAIMMMATALSLTATNASAGGPLTIGLNDDVTVKDSSGGEAYVDWWIADADTDYTYNVGDNSARANARTNSPVSGARVVAGIYKEINFEAGAGGTYTATMTGNYKGQCYISGLIPGITSCKVSFYFRVIDLTNVPPNNIVNEVVVKSWQRTIYGTETHKANFAETLTWTMDGGNCANARFGLEACVIVQAESWDPTAWPIQYAQGNAWKVKTTLFGIWYSSIHIVAPKGFDGVATNPIPANGATGVPLTTTLSWTPPSGANYYYVEIWTGSYANPTWGPVGIGKTTPSWTVTLSPSVTWSWHVKCSADGGATWGPQSAIWSFTTSNGGPTYKLTVSGLKGAITPAPGTYTYNAGTVVTCTAQDAYYTNGHWWLFDWWTIDGVDNDGSTTAVVTMNSDHTASAHYTRTNMQP